MERKKLEELDVGDKVLVKCSCYTRLAEIDRITQRFIFVDGMKFNRADGCRSPYHSWDKTHIVHATPDDVEKYLTDTERNTNLSKIKRTNLGLLSNEQLEQIVKIIGENPI